MADIRFWDTSALIKVFDSREAHHRRARGLWSGPRSRRVEHATSALVAIEAIRKFYRAVPDQVPHLEDALRSLYIVAIDGTTLPVAHELAKHSRATGADTAIVACAVALKRSSGKVVEIVTGDADQAALAAREGVEIVRLWP